MSVKPDNIQQEDCEAHYICENNFTKVSNGIILDSSINEFQKILYMYMVMRLSQNPKWKFNVWKIMKDLPNKKKKIKKKDTIYENMEALEQSGWIEVIRAKGKKNIYIVYSDPTLSKNKEYARLEHYASKSLQNFSEVIEKRLEGFEFTIPMSYLFEGTNDFEVQFTAKGNNTFETSGTVQQDGINFKIVEYLFKYMQFHCINFIKTNRR